MQGGVNISVAGGLSFGVAYLLHGAMHNNPQDNANLPMPFPDALQEFSVATSGLSAQNGMHSGASVNAVTKSGTNNLHGNGFEFLRDRRFNAKDAFAAIGPDGKKKDDGLRRNQYGGTLGGPIVRNKVFFFTGYQGTGFGQPMPMFKIQKPPFYAAWATPILHDTVAGLRISQKCEVIDLHGRVIPGLYCAGESAGGFALHGLPRVTVFGRVAGPEAARARAWGHRRPRHHDRRVGPCLAAGRRATVGGQGWREMFRVGAI